MKLRTVVCGCLVAVMVVLACAAPAQAFPLFDRLVYKLVFLRAIHTTVLVNRFSGNVKGIVSRDGLFTPIAGPALKNLQAMYDFQVRAQ